MTATFHNLALVENEYLVCILDCGQTMCNGDGSTTLHQSFKSLRFVLCITNNDRDIFTMQIYNKSPTSPKDIGRIILVAQERERKKRRKGKGNQGQKQKQAGMNQPAISL